MSLCKRVLRLIGFTQIGPSAAEIDEAEDENVIRAVVENAAAHTELKRLYEEEVPRSSKKLKTSIAKSSTSISPFGDFEEMMKRRTPSGEGHG